MQNNTQITVSEILKRDFSFSNCNVNLSQIATLAKASYDDVDWDVDFSQMAILARSK